VDEEFRIRAARPTLFISLRSMGSRPSRKRRREHQIIGSLFCGLIIEEALPLLRRTASDLWIERSKLRFCPGNGGPMRRIIGGMHESVIMTVISRCERRELSGDRCHVTAIDPLPV
jgi:hypothetical protein